MQPAVFDLVRAAQAGDEPAWNLLYRQYHPKIYSVALRICGNTPAAKDAVQDAFVSAFLKLSQLQDPAAFGAWIKKIVIRSCYKTLQDEIKTKNSCTVSNKPDNGSEENMDDGYEKLSRQGRLYTALDKLSEPLTAVLLLRYFSNFSSYDQIGSILAIPIGTVRSRLNQGRAKLAEQWRLHPGSGCETFHESEEWNHFYYAAFKGLHWHDDEKKRFIGHLQKNVRVIYSRDTVHIGSSVIDGLVMEDRQAGSWFSPTNVQSCGDISVVEAKHYNAPENPEHCPDSSVCVLRREKGRVSQMNLYFSPK